MSISKQHGIAQFIPLLTSWHIWTPCRSLSGWGWGRWGSGWWCPSAAGRSQSSSSPRWSSSGSKSENYNSSINEVWMYEIISLLWHDIFAATKNIFFLSLAWRYLSCSAAADSVMTSEACLSALLAFCSPSAAITCTVETLLLAFLKSTNLSHI